MVRAAAGGAGARGFPACADANHAAQREASRDADESARATGSPERGAASSVTLPWLATRSSSTRRPPCRATRRPRTANCLTTEPGARTTTTTPSRTRTATRAPAEGRVVTGQERRGRRAPHSAGPSPRRGATPT
jgi:hypothetical protein